MIESPLLKELMAESERAGMRKCIMRILVARFGRGARDLRSSLEAITDEEQLDKLTDLSATCPDLESFKKRLGLPPRKRK
jgi:hypothetical protein